MASFLACRENERELPFMLSCECLCSLLLPCGALVLFVVIDYSISPVVLVLFSSPRFYQIQLVGGLKSKQ